MEKKVKWVELGEICEFQVGLTASKEQMLKEKVNEWFKPLIKIGNFSDSGISTQELCWIDPSNFQNTNRFIAAPNEILVAKDGCTAGKIVLNNWDCEVFFSSHIYKFQPNLEVINQRYLFYALTINQKKLSTLKTSGPIPALELARVKKLKIPLPSLQQQEKIAKWLDTFSSLERQLERHKNQYRYYLEQLMRGGRMVELNSLCEFLAGLAVPSREQYDDNENGRLEAIVRVNDFQDLEINSSKWIYIDSSKYPRACQCKAQPGEILIARWGSAGELACNNLKKEIIFSKNIYKFQPNLEVINQRYLFFALTSTIPRNIHLIREKRTIPALNLDCLKRLKISLPSLEKQKQIADWLDKFRELTNSITKGLPREIFLLKQQSKYYREKLIS